MKAWSIKYALSTGKITFHDVDFPDGKYGYVGTGFDRQQLVLGKDIFPNPVTARARAEVARDSKIASLERQIKKLKAIEFVVESET